MIYVWGCVRDGSENPTLFSVDCNVQPDPCGHALIIILIFANTYLPHCLIRDIKLRKLRHGRLKLRVN
jgi:hypothetical protein